MDRLETMKTFVAVAQEGSFTAGARRLNISTKLASKYVKELETRLDAQLFNRTTRSVSLTEVGTAYLQRCIPMLDQFEELDDLVKEKQSSLSGSIRITAPTGFGSTKLPDALLPFVAEHPKVEIDLVLSDSRVSLVEDGFDLAVRVGLMRDSTLIVKRLSDMPLIVCASPAYLERHGRPRAPGALATHNCLVDENLSDPSVWRFTSADDKTIADETTVKVSGTLHANSPAAIVRMAIGGQGIARCPLYAVEDGLASGQLERILPDYNADMFGLLALYPPNRHLTARLRRLIDHLAEFFRR